MGRCMGSEVERRMGMTILMQTVWAIEKVYESRHSS